MQLLAEAQLDVLAVATIAGQPRTTSRFADRDDQLGGRHRHPGRQRTVFGMVEPDDRVVVHQAAGLELGDLPRTPRATRWSQSRSPSPARAASTRTSSTVKRGPQPGGVLVPQQPLSVVVIRRRVDRLPELVRDALAAPSRTCTARPSLRIVCTTPNDGAVSDANTCGCSSTAVGTPLRPPASPEYLIELSARAWGRERER
jgi:hypothetical protein